MIKTYTINIYLNQKMVKYTNLSRVAVKRYLEHYKKSKNYIGYSVGPA